MANAILQKAKELVAQVILPEKVSLCSGQNLWGIRVVERLENERVKNIALCTSPSRGLFYIHFTFLWFQILHSRGIIKTNMQKWGI